MRIFAEKIKRSVVGGFDFDGVESVEECDEKSKPSHGRKLPKDEIAIKLQCIAFVNVNVHRATAKEAGKKRVGHFQLKLMRAGRNLKDFCLPIAECSDFNIVNVDYFVED